MLSDEIITAYSITSEIYQSNELIKNKIVVIRKNISLKQNIIEQNLVDNNYESINSVLNELQDLYIQLYILEAILLKNNKYL